ncbi:MAG: ABC transporter ATP-binding protein [Ferruginibacter sp.]
MNIILQNTGKRFNREWIFRHCSHTFQSGKAYAITGPNGSGKSTLLQVIAGAVQHSEGGIQYLSSTSAQPATASDPRPTINPQPLTNIHRHLAIAAPYLDLIEEMTAKEILQFHEQFKPLTAPIKDILAKVGLTKATDKQMRYFSSGMKQRLKLAQAFFSDTPVLLLDEPTTNLDAEGVALYLQLVKEHTPNRLVIVSSNDKQEYAFCEEVLSINDYKTA